MTGMLHTAEMVLSPMFPAAVRAIDALHPVHTRNPDGVKGAAEDLEACLQAYGRCLLASSRPENRDESVREAEMHMFLRNRVRASLDELIVNADPPTEESVRTSQRAVDHLMYTIDQVLAKQNVHCVAVSSGLRA